MPCKRASMAGPFSPLPAGGPHNWWVWEQYLTVYRPTISWRSSFPYIGAQEELPTKCVE